MQNDILINLLVNLKAEVQTLRTLLYKEILEKDSTIDAIAFSETERSLTEEAKSAIWAQIKAHYFLDESTDDLINQSLKGDS